MTTIIEDRFEDEPIPSNGIVHNIVYGRDGWTDALSAETIALLVSIGAISWERTVSGGGFETHLYVSRRGALPSGTV